MLSINIYIEYNNLYIIHTPNFWILRSILNTTIFTSYTHPIFEHRNMVNFKIYIEYKNIHIIRTAYVVNFKIYIEYTNIHIIHTAYEKAIIWAMLSLGCVKIGNFLEIFGKFRFWKLSLTLTAWADNSIFF